MHLVQGTGDALQAGILVAVGRAAGVHHEIGKAEHFGAIQFVSEGLDGFSEEGFIGGGEVDEVAVVGQRQSKFGLLQRGFEKSRFVGRDRFGGPLRVVLGEKLDAFGFQRDRGLEGLVIAARNGLMSTEEWHYGKLPPFREPRRNGVLARSSRFSM